MIADLFVLVGFILAGTGIALAVVLIRGVGREAPIMAAQAELDATVDGPCPAGVGTAVSPQGRIHPVDCTCDVCEWWEATQQACDLTAVKRAEQRAVCPNDDCEACGFIRFYDRVCAMAFTGRVRWSAS